MTNYILLRRSITVTKTWKSKWLVFIRLKSIKPVTALGIEINPKETVSPFQEMHPNERELGKPGRDTLS